VEEEKNIKSQSNTGTDESFCRKLLNSEQTRGEEGKESPGSARSQKLVNNKFEPQPLFNDMKACVSPRGGAHKREGIARGLLQGLASSFAAVPGARCAERGKGA